MSDLSNAQIIIAAITVAGPRPIAPARPKGDDPAALAEYSAELVKYDAAQAAWDQAVKTNARDITVMTTDRSKVYGQVSALRKAIDPTSSDGKVFVGTVVSVSKEASSTRGLITLYTGTDQAKPGLPAGHEQIRTDRTDDVDGRAMARAAQLLIGHRVTVYLEMEPIRGGTQKARVLRHIDDQGIDPSFDSAAGQMRLAA